MKVMYSVLAYPLCSMVLPVSEDPEDGCGSCWVDWGGVLDWLSSLGVRRLKILQFCSTNFPNLPQDLAN